PERPDATTPDRIDHKLAIMRARMNHMEFRAHAIDEFYGQLTAEQQHIFDEFFRTLRDKHKQT
ncbi:MAG TPA: Spy/CpxP family protein refolding chaperone, partial [Burkholderiales bacterium]|nr:Spy/CpxP family protein refolding chaperone [Burkholderiales bacterium]